MLNHVTSLTCPQVLMLKEFEDNALFLLPSTVLTSEESYKACVNMYPLKDELHVHV